MGSKRALKETVDESARRISEGTLIGCLFFAYVGILMILTQSLNFSWESLWGSYPVDKGPIVVGGVGVALTVWSFSTLWICYLRRVRRVLPYMCTQVSWFLLLVGLCLTVSVLPYLIYMPRVYRIISLCSLIVLFIYAHFFHKRVKLAVSKMIKQGEDDQQIE